MNMLNDLTHKEAHYLWRIGHKKGLIEDEPPATPPAFPILVDKLSSCEYEKLVLAAAGDSSFLAYSVMEKLIAKPIYMCARGETSVELLDDKNHPIITPQGSYRGIANQIPFGVAKEYQKRFRAFKATVDNRIVVSVVENPKKPGTAAYEHFSQYTIGKSVTWNLLNTDITRADFRWDEKKGFVQVVSPAEYEQAKTAMRKAG